MRSTHNTDRCTHASTTQTVTQQACGGEHILTLRSCSYRAVSLTHSRPPVFASASFFLYLHNDSVMLGGREGRGGSWSRVSSFCRARNLASQHLVQNGGAAKQSSRSRSWGQRAGDWLLTHIHTLRRCSRPRTRMPLSQCRAAAHCGILARAV
jgi:hypothetical protein